MRRRGLLLGTLTVVLLALQAWCTLRASSQIRYEELAESVRNPWWLAHRALYDSTSSNLGWYAPILVAYRVLGFHLFLVRWLRVALEAVSLAAAADLLRRTLGDRAWLPLLAWGLSPTLLFLVTSQASFGIDLQIAPIVAWLLFSRAPGIDAEELSRAGLAFFLAMLAWMAFPAIALYLPSMFVLQGVRVRRAAPRERASHGRFLAANAVACLVGFLAPFALSLLLVDDVPTLLAGIFRGGGHLSPSPSLFASNLVANLSDLFVRGASYHYERVVPELGLAVPAIALAAAIAVVVREARRDRATREIVVAVAVIALLCLVIADFSDGPPGARRTTPVVFAIFVLFSIAWRAADLASPRGRAWAAALALFPLQHLVAFPINLVHETDPSPWADPWFTEKAPPRESLARYVERARGPGLVIGCEAADCRFQEIYATVASACALNDLDCKPIYGVDPRTKKPVPLTIRLWQTGGWEH